MRTACAKALWPEGAKLASRSERKPVRLGQRGWWEAISKMGLGKKVGGLDHTAPSP